MNSAEEKDAANGIRGIDSRFSILRLLRNQFLNHFSRFRVVRRSEGDKFGPCGPRDRPRPSFRGLRRFPFNQVMSGRREVGRRPAERRVSQSFRAPLLFAKRIRACNCFHGGICCFCQFNPEPSPSLHCAARPPQPASQPARTKPRISPPRRRFSFPVRPIEKFGGGTELFCRFLTLRRAVNMKGGRRRRRRRSFVRSFVRCFLLLLLHRRQLDER